MSFGDGMPVEPSVARARDWPTLRQFGVFLENRVGRLHDLLRQVERDDLRIVAMSITESIDYAVARLIMNNYERTVELLNFAGYHYCETDVIGVELPGTDQPHVSICKAVMQAEVNIHYMHPMIYRRNGHGAIAVYVDDVDETLRVLGEAGHRIITENDLLMDDEFFD